MNEERTPAGPEERAGKETPCPKASPGERFIQIGVTALRDPKTGEYLPAVPLYIEASEGSKAEEAVLIQDVGRLFADRMRRYKAECAAAGAAV